MKEYTKGDFVALGIMALVLATAPYWGTALALWVGWL